jgi:hypothetical protein
MKILRILMYMLLTTADAVTDDDKDQVQEYIS